MNENAAIDGNTRWTLTAVTNDGNQYIRRVRVNPITGAVLCEANVVSNNTMIGSTIPGGTEGSVLFIGPGSTLAQDNSEFFWDDTNHYLGLGTDTPAATLDVEGTFKYADGTQANGYVLVSDASGNAHWAPGGGGGSGVSQIIAGTDISISPSGGTGIVTVNVNVSALANDVTFITDLTSNSTFITDTATSLLSDVTFVTDLANNSTFISTLTSNTTFLSDIATNSTFVTDLVNNNTFTTDLANNTNFITTLTSNSTFTSDIVNIINTDPSISINLATQVTGILPVANGGTGDSSFTAYAPIFGGTTSTGHLQSGTVGTAGQVLTSNGAGALPTFQTVSAVLANTNGVFSRALNAAATTQTIAHGLGTTPSKVRITATVCNPTGSGVPLVFSTSVGTYNGTTTACVYNFYNTDASFGVGGMLNDTTTTYAVYVMEESSGPGYQHGVITVDATNIYIAWTTDAAASSWTISCMWEAEA